MRLLYCFLFYFCICSSSFSIEPLPDFVDIPLIRQIDDAGIYQDVISHSVEAPFGNDNGRSTNVHESAHGIHATYRNMYTSSLKERHNALYCLNGKIALVKELDFLLSNVKDNIPPSLRSYRFKLYFSDQLKYWNDRPTYVLDEWTAYICGGESSIDDYARKIKVDTGTDEVSGCLDFSIYSIALYITAKQRAREHLEQNPQLKRIIYYNLERASKAFFEGRFIFKSKKQEELYDNLLNSEDAEEIRKCLKEEFDSFFLNK
jgi:hypothetical protein